MSCNRKTLNLSERECRTLKKLCKEAIRMGETVIIYKTGLFDIHWLLKCIERAQDETDEMPYAANYKGSGSYNFMKIL